MQSLLAGFASRQVKRSQSIVAVLSGSVFNQPFLLKMTIEKKPFKSIFTWDDGGNKLSLDYLFLKFFTPGRSHQEKIKELFQVCKLLSTVLQQITCNFDFILSEKSHSPWLEWQFKLTTGYFISDTIQMYMQGPGCTHRLGFVAHHILCAIAVYTTLHTSIGYFFIGFKMMTELSTPFMNIR